ESIPPMQAALAAGAVALATLLALACARTRPWWLVGWLWYVGMLVPVLGLVQVGMQARADRYTYLPLVGLAIAVAWGARDNYMVHFYAARSRLVARRLDEAEQQFREA